MKPVTQQHPPTSTSTSTNNNNKIYPTPNESTTEEPEVSDEHFRYQVVFSELFDWLASCDESLSYLPPNFINPEIIKSRIFGLQVSNVVFQCCLAYSFFLYFKKFGTPCSIAFYHYYMNLFTQPAKKTTSALNWKVIRRGARWEKVTFTLDFLSVKRLICWYTDGQDSV